MEASLSQGGDNQLGAPGAEFGTVARVLTDGHLDLFDGIVVTAPNGIRFVDRDRIATITTATVTTTGPAPSESALGSVA